MNYKLFTSDSKQHLYQKLEAQGTFYHPVTSSLSDHTLHQQCCKGRMLTFPHFLKRCYPMHTSKFGMSSCDLETWLQYRCLSKIQRHQTSSTTQPPLLPEKVNSMQSREPPNLA